MQFTITKKDLLPELAHAIGVLDNRNTIPVLQYLQVKTDGSDAITITATDLDISMRLRAPAEVAQPGELLLHGRKLKEIVAALPDAPIKIESSDNGAVVTCERSRFKILGIPAENYREIPQFKISDTRINDQALHYAITHIAHAITKEESQRYALAGARMEFKEGGLLLIATDGHRLGFVKKDNAVTNGKDGSALVPKKTIERLVGLLADYDGAAAVGYDADENHLYFQVGGRLLISRKLSGQFPNYELVLPTTINHVVTADRAALLASINRVALLADEKSHGIKFTFANNQIEAVSRNSEAGEAFGVIGAEYAGAEISCGFNATYLTQVLSVIESEQVTIEFKDLQSQAQIKPVGNGEYDERHIVMPMRV